MIGLTTVLMSCPTTKEIYIDPDKQQEVVPSPPDAKEAVEVGQIVPIFDTWEWKDYIETAEVNEDNPVIVMDMDYWFTMAEFFIEYNSLLEKLMSYAENNVILIPVSELSEIIEETKE